MLCYDVVCENKKRNVDNKKKQWFTEQIAFSLKKN